MYLISGYIPWCFFLPKPKCCAEVGQLAAGEIVHVLEAADIKEDVPKKLGCLLPKMIPCWMLKVLLALCIQQLGWICHHKKCYEL